MSKDVPTTRPSEPAPCIVQICGGLALRLNADGTRYWVQERRQGCGPPLILGTYPEIGLRHALAPLAAAISTPGDVDGRAPLWRRRHSHASNRISAAMLPEERRGAHFCKVRSPSQVLRCRTRARSGPHASHPPGTGAPSRRQRPLIRPIWRHRRVPPTRARQGVDPLSEDVRRGQLRPLFAGQHPSRNHRRRVAHRRRCPGSSIKAMGPKASFACSNP